MPVPLKALTPQNSREHFNRLAGAFEAGTDDRQREPVRQTELVLYEKSGDVLFRNYLTCIDN
jgi:hypothetical protein